MSTGTIQPEAAQVIKNLKSDAIQMGFTNDSGGELKIGDDVALKADGTLSKRTAGTSYPLGIVVKGGADGERITVRTHFTAIIDGMNNSGGVLNAGTFVVPEGTSTVNADYPDYTAAATTEYVQGVVIVQAADQASVRIGIIDGIHQMP